VTIIDKKKNKSPKGQRANRKREKEKKEKKWKKEEEKEKEKVKNTVGLTAGGNGSYVTRPLTCAPPLSFGRLQTDSH